MEILHHTWRASVGLIIHDVRRRRPGADTLDGGGGARHRRGGRHGAGFSGNPATVVKKIAELDQSQPDRFDLVGVVRRPEP